jgi:hypothetical protein
MPLPGWRWMRGPALPAAASTTPAPPPATTPAPAASTNHAAPPTAATARPGWSADLLARLGMAKSGDDPDR